MGKVSMSRLIFSMVLLWLVCMLVFEYYYITSPDIFDCRASVNPTIIDVSQGGTTQASVNVEFGLLYNNDVNLRAEPNSSHIHVYFKPEIIRRGGDSISTVVISADKEAHTGEYKIPITLSSADRDEHWYNIKLIVLPSQMSTSTSTETPTVAETPTVTEAPTVTETPKSIRMPDVSQINTIIGIGASIATIFGSYIAYKQYKKYKD